MATFQEYLNPADWSLHVVNVDNDAAGEDWIKLNNDTDYLVKMGNDRLQVAKKDIHKIKSSALFGGVLWQRPQQPEELPFIDDEPVIVGELVYSSVGDDETKTVNDTLAERQSQYGCFEDVAFVTENIISVMKKCNFDNMPHPHKMAMYMIASKMARIVNGDFNHKDSWHDIQGYAKLIEKLIGGEK